MVILPEPFSPSPLACGRREISEGSQRRYLNDATYHALVTGLAILIRDELTTAEELCEALRIAVDLACAWRCDHEL